MSDTVLPWIAGMLFSLVGGHFGTQHFIECMRISAGCGDDIYKRYLKYYEHKFGGKPCEKEFNPGPFPPLYTGFLERLFFTTVIGFSVSKNEVAGTAIVGIATAMMGWLAVKMVTNLNRMFYWPPHAIVRHRALTGLLGGLISLFFALIGGLICAGRIPIPQFYPG